MAKYVPYSSRCKCSLGTMENYLSTDKGHGALFGGNPIMNANDHVVGTHITHFGECATLTAMANGFPKKCKAFIPTSWINVNKSYLVEGAPALTMDSLLPCFYGGVISITSLPPTPEDSVEDNEGDNVSETDQQDSIAAEVAIASAATSMSLLDMNIGDNNELFLLGNDSGIEITNENLKIFSNSYLAKTMLTNSDLILLGSEVALETNILSYQLMGANYLLKYKTAENESLTFMGAEGEIEAQWNSATISGEAYLLKSHVESEDGNHYATAKVGTVEGEAGFEFNVFDLIPTVEESIDVEYDSDLKKIERDDKDDDDDEKAYIGLNAEASATIAALTGVAHTSAGNNMLGGSATAEGKLLAAEAEVAVRMGVNEDDEFEFGAEANALASVASGEVGGTINIFGLEIGASVEGHAVAAGVSAEIGFDDGKFSIGADAAAFLGIGLNFTIGLAD